ncbi:MAG: hypothetical protein WDO17_17300 [Alphaproteobacteria bacterium]
MLSDEQLLLAVRELAASGQKGPVLMLLSEINQPAQTASVRDKGLQIGFRGVTQWHLSAILKNAANEGLVAQLADGWRITSLGLKLIEKHYIPEAAIILETRHSLRAHLQKIADEQRRAFVEEAIKSFDVKAYRAAIVLSWVGAAHIIQDHIVTNHRAAFNAAGAAKVATSGGKYRFNPVKSAKEFGVIGEAEMLQLCQDAGILHKAEKQILQDRLDLRNQCGHPNPVVVAEHAVANHLEILMLNVYSRY